MEFYVRITFVPLLSPDGRLLGGDADLKHVGYVRALQDVDVPWHFTGRTFWTSW